MRGVLALSDANPVSRTITPDERAVARLYAHCALFNRMTMRVPSRARLRLEEELGPDLARTLVAALSTNRRRNG